MDTTTFFVYAAVCGVIASLIGQFRGSGPVKPFVIGALLGVIGIILVTVLPVRKRPEKLIADWGADINERPR